MKKDTSQSTILTISMGFLILYVAFSWPWAIFASLTVGVVGILSKFLRERIEWGWMKLAKILGYVVPNILLSILFYLFLFPLALISRIFTKDPLMLSRKYDSYFVVIDKEINKSYFEKMW